MVNGIRWTALLIGVVLAAARGGMKTLTVEQFNCLGGVGAAGGHVHISRYDGNGTNRPYCGRETAPSVLFWMVAVFEH